MLAGSVKLWPTATAGDAKASGAAGYSTESGRHSGTTLTDAAVRGLWPTPHGMQVECAGLAVPESHSTPGKPQDWPTPNAADAIGGKGPRIGMSNTGRMPDGSKATVNLRAAIVLKDAEFLDRFATSIRDEIHRANRHGAPDSHGKAPIRGSLNPRWVAQLMGFPVDWLDSHPPTAAKPSRRLATPSRRRARTTSGEQS